MARSTTQPGPQQVPASLAQAPGFQCLLAGRDLTSSHALAFPSVAPPAHSFFAAALLKRLPPAVSWLICRDARHQERVASELLTWGHNPLFLPHLDSSEEAVPDPESAAERLFVLETLRQARAQAETPVIVLRQASLESPVPPLEATPDASLRLTTGATLSLARLKARLLEAGFEQEAQVFQRGQFAQRGGIFDLFPWQTPLPIRIEFFDEEIESLREFDLHSQISSRTLDSAQVVLEKETRTTHRLRDWMQESDLKIALDATATGSQFWITQEDLEDLDLPDRSWAAYENPLGRFEAGDFILQEAKREDFHRRLAAWQKEAWDIHLFFQNQAEEERYQEMVLPLLKTSGSIQHHLGNLVAGFTVPAAKLAILSASELFGRYHVNTSRRRFRRDVERTRSSKELDFSELKENEFVVHLEYGIGRYRGIAQQEDKGLAREVLVLEFEHQARLFVPLDQSHLVSRYVGLGKAKPKLNKLGDGKWKRVRQNVERSVMDYAAKLLAIQAERQTEEGFPHDEDNKWQLEFEKSFPYQETDDQVTAILETKSDMQSARPMDRLICGDVGFGKTEVALRAAFKSVMSGKQVAILVPTTVLAQQHWQNFRERMSEFPITIELLNRYRTAGDQRQVVEGLADGSVDIVIGTHRLTSPHVTFQNLGLVVIDEEQRFGVAHKERFKERFRLVDILTLSATPIPRTLYLSLMGARDMSTIETPPPNRIPVETRIVAYDERIIRSAIQRELDRGGQVYFLHNRVRSIQRLQQRVAELCPEAKVLVGHGQMDKGQLEDVMQQFIDREADVLLATTIIESGIDIPNANTILIDRADRFGLADLYQLRGRVGRSHQQAYAYLLLPPDQLAAGDVRKRIRAIREYSSLGAGFRIAMRDLEIRGAGNLLGTKQSGHIVNIGFDLYCQLLKTSIAKLQGGPAPTRREVALRIDFLAGSEQEAARRGEALPAYLPPDFMGQSTLRVEAYRAVAQASSRKELNKLRREWRDRFGRIPAPAETLLTVAELRILASDRGLSSVEISQCRLMISRNDDFILLDGKFPRLESPHLRDRLQEAVDLLKRL
ncbi:MAG: transcription-repair coupling factor [Verrucomicrobiota bacterium]